MFAFLFKHVISVGSQSPITQKDSEEFLKSMNIAQSLVLIYFLPKLTKTSGIGDETSPHNGINQSYYVYTKHYGHEYALKLIKEEFPVTIAIPGTVYSSEISDSGLGKLFRLFYQGQKAVMAINSYNS